MRLIDADLLIESIQATLNMGRESFPACLFCEVIDEQPIAFDVDEVVRQIKDIKEKEYVACTDQKCRYCKYLSTCSCRDKADKLALDRAIENVKGGGTE